MLPTLEAMSTSLSFARTVDLVRQAELALIKTAGMTDPDDRACTLRGIYYGAPWSLDFKVESKRSVVGGWVRNLGFLAYTAGHWPADPRPALGKDLFNQLQSNQIVGGDGQAVDLGHILIGLDTRSSSIMRSVVVKGQGGTGLEIVTWLGDLGGGAASLARRRATKPAASVKAVFVNAASDYGAADNLEGDVGGFLVASGSTPGGAPVWDGGKGVADVLADYFPIGSAQLWNARAQRFAIALGANVSKSGITNMASFTQTLAAKIYDFGVSYAATRWIPSGEVSGKAADAMCRHLTGAATEVATVFVNLLARGIKSPSTGFHPSSYPHPSPAATTCNSTLLSAASTDPSAVRKQLENWRTGLRDLFN